MKIEIPPNYITRAAERLRELGKRMPKHHDATGERLKRLKKQAAEQREREAGEIIASQAALFWSACVNPRFTERDVKVALGKALAKRRAGEDVTVMPMREMRPAPEPPPGHRLNRLPPEPPEEWVLEAARSRAPRMPIEPPLSPSRRSKRRQPGKNQTDFFTELLGCPQVSVP